MNDAAVTPETILVPLAGQARRPLPSSKERAEFVASLEVESGCIKSGQYTLFDKESFLKTLRQDYATYRQANAL